MLLLLNKDNIEEIASNILNDLNFKDKLDFEEMEQVLKFALKEVRTEI